MPRSHQFAIGQHPIGGLIAAIAVTLVVTACVSQAEGSPEPPPDADGNPVVALTDLIFDPTEVVVDVGATVTWKWQGGVPHDVAGDDFASNIQTDGTFQHTFAEAGTYGYRCNVHPGMQGTVVVVSS